MKDCAKRFRDAMEDNFNTPEALAAIFELVTLGNTFLSQNDPAGAKSCAKSVRELCAVLGLELKTVKASLGDFEEEIEKLIKMRNDARRGKNFKEADKIRETLLKQGIILEDTKEGTSWRRKV